MGLSPVEAGESLGNQVYGSIRDAIASRLLPPGARVIERALAAELGVSPTPIREALRRLEQEGLIQRRGSRGVYVAEMQVSELSDMLYLQAVLRGAAAHPGSSRRRGLLWRAAVRATA